MGERNGKNPSLPPAEEGSLSQRMRDLMLGQRVEDRRKSRNDADDAGLTKDRRRRDDHTPTSASDES